MYNILPTDRTMPIEDLEIRSALIALLGAARHGDSKVLEEFRIERGVAEETDSHKEVSGTRKRLQACDGGSGNTRRRQSPGRRAARLYKRGRV